MKFAQVEGNSQKLDGGAMYGNVPRPVWEKWSPTDSRGRIDLACRALLVEIQGKKMLFEAGIGIFFPPHLADRFGVQNSDRHILVESLQKLGIQPNEIDWVILSHLHFDHAGGLLPSYQEIQNGHEGLIFPNASFIVGRDAFERASHPHPRDRASFIEDLPIKLEKTGKLYLIEKGQPSPIFPEHIEFLFSEGHTPGQMHSLISNGDSKLFFAGDLIPGRPWVHTPITMGYDRFPEKLIDEKEQIYHRAINERWKIFFTHDVGCSYCEIIKNEKNKFECSNPVSNKAWEKL